ncbi:hypothetical protein CJ217_01765 [Streptococcus sp. UMB1385]|nr:hypothetical protein CJ217_01765 [Streptococcus sp. UMB1385]
MKIKVAKLKDTDAIFIDYKGYKIGYQLKQFEYKNNLCIQLESEQEKEKFISIFRYFLKELERLEI